MIVQAVGHPSGVFLSISPCPRLILSCLRKNPGSDALFNAFINLLLLTPLGIGADETGNNSWLSIPGFPVNLQPAELAKLTFVLLLAWQMNRPGSGDSAAPPPYSSWRGHTLVMIGLIVATSGDFGMALTYAFILSSWPGRAG